MPRAQKADRTELQQCQLELSPDYSKSVPEAPIFTLYHNSVI